MSFIHKLEKIVKKNNSLVCVGLDSNFDKIPDKFKKEKYPQFEFNKNIIDQTNDLVCCYKPNSAFYEAKGVEGIKELKMTFDYINSKYLHIPTILDAKRGDIGSTNKGYVSFAFEYLKSDAITINAYPGQEALLPFLDRKDKGIIIWCKTSNPGAAEFQDIEDINGNKIYLIIARNVIEKWNKNGNCLLVIGATYPKELEEIRNMSDLIWFLIPGIGAQGGDVEKTVRAGQNSQGRGMIINSSRNIIFSKNPREEALKLKQEINKYRNKLKNVR